MTPDTILPCYVACDESLSMAGHAGTVARVVATFVDGLRDAATDSTARVRLGLIGFSDSAQVLLPLGPLGAFEFPPVPRRSTSITSFRKAFRFLLGIVEADINRLLTCPAAVRRPVVLFVSDGQPTDPATWPAAHAALIDPARPAHPHLITAGIGDADTVTLDRIATMPAPPGRAAAVLDDFTCASCCSVLIRRAPVASSSSHPSAIQHSRQR